jgi:hypothetical protein
LFQETYKLTIYHRRGRFVLVCECDCSLFATCAVSPPNSHGIVCVISQLPFVANPARHRCMWIDLEACFCHCAIGNLTSASGNLTSACLHDRVCPALADRQAATKSANTSANNSTAINQRRPLAAYRTPCHQILIAMCLTYLQLDELLESVHCPKSHSAAIVSSTMC